MKYIELRLGQCVRVGGVLIKNLGLAPRNSDAIRLGFDAPLHVRIMRQELQERLDEGREQKPAG